MGFSTNSLKIVKKFIVTVMVMAYDNIVITKEKDMFTDNTNCHDAKPSYFAFERRHNDVVAV